MQLEDIKALSGEDTELFQTLSSGYLRGLDINALISCMKQNIHTAYADKIYRSLERHDAFSIHASVVAEYFLGLISKDMPYRELRRIAYLLSMLISHCSKDIQVQAWDAFINSGKRSIRKYAYQIPAEIIGSRRLEDAWKIAENHTDEVVFLASTLLETVPESELSKWKKRILENSYIPDSIKRKFFRRKESLDKEDYNFLKENMPRTYIYEAAMRQEFVDDETCYNLYLAEMNQKEPWLRMDIKTFSHYMGKPDYDGLLLWCFSKMGKWDLVQKILKEGKSNEN